MYFQLVSERCTVSRVNSVVEVKPTYILLFSEIQSPKVHLIWYITFVFCKTPIEVEELLLISKLEVLNLFLYMIIFISLLGSVGSIFPLIDVLKYFHLIYNCNAFGYDKKFDNFLLIGWSVTVFILLADISNYTFNLFINNIVRQHIIDERLFYIFNSL